MDRNRPTFHSLTANLRPVLMSFSLYRRSVPMRPLVAHSRTASAPYFPITWSGTYRLKPSGPADLSRSRLDSFLPCSLSPQPEISAVRHGTRPNSSSDCTTE